MNIESMRVRSYRSIAADEHVPEEAAERYRTLKACRNLRAAGCSEEGALEQVGISRRTRYRQRTWKPRNVKAVMDVQPQVPVHGQGAHPRHAGAQGRPPERVDGRPDHRTRPGGRRDPPRPFRSTASFCEGRVKPKRRCSFAKWATRWKYGSKARRPGELVQIDHMTYTDGGQTLKEFRAVCPVSKFMVTRVYSRATAGNAKRFLMDLLGALPFPLLSVQADGGSEFMAGFEDACEELRVPLHVLPPRRPQWNGCVERANRSARIEFWSLYDGPLTVAGVAPALARFEFFFNYERPHTSLAYRTPNEYLAALEAA